MRAIRGQGLSETAEEAVGCFERAAREYCCWIDTVLSKSEEATQDDLATGLRKIASLYSAALSLPEVETDKDYQVGGEQEPGSAATMLRALRERLGDRSLYWSVYEAGKNEGVVAGDLADDLCDIYADVAHGLTLFDGGDKPEGVWMWLFSFGSHWGQHAVDALRVLHGLRS